MWQHCGISRAIINKQRAKTLFLEVNGGVMKAIDFVVRTGAGAVQRGEISADQTVTAIQAGGGKEISLNLRQVNLSTYVRSGENLEIVLADGRVVILEDYFSGDGAADSRLFISAEGYLNEVDVVQGADSALYAQYGPTEQWGKWSPSDDLIFLGGSEVANAAGVVADEEVSMLGAGLLGGGLFSGGALAGGAALAGLAGVVGGGGGGGGSTHIDATVNESGVITIGGDGTTDADRVVTITGTAEPESEVVVTIGGQTQTVISDDDGNWEAVFEGDTFPGEGEFSVVVVVTEPDGTIVNLTGPTLDIDTIGPEITVTTGTDSVGDFVNGENHADGTEISGTGEAGATLVVTVEGVSHETVVAEDGTWSVVFTTTEVIGGEYTTDVSIVSVDGHGNSTTVTDTLIIDTVADPITINTATFEGDGTLNGTEGADGIEVTGTSTPGVTVTVDIDGVSMDVVVASDGTWSAVFPEGSLPGGEYDATVTVSTSDWAGNSNTVTGTVRIDTVGSVAIDEALIEGDDVINASEANDGVTLTGTSEAGSTVDVSFGGVTHSAVVAADGSWSVNFAASEIASGEYDAEFSVVATDAAGNMSVASRTVRIDTETSVAIDAGLVGGDDFVNAAEAANGITLTGTAEPGASVEVTLGSVTHSATVDAMGNWSVDFAPSDIPAGTYTSVMTVVSTDAAGNSQTVTGDLDIDTLAFVAFDSTPVEGDGVVNAVEASDGVVLTGTTEPGSTVTVTMGAVSHAAVVDASGHWTANFASYEVPAGEYETAISAVAIDANGNTSTTNDTINIDTLVRNFAMTNNAGGADGIINADEATSDLVFTGTTEPGSSVEVTLGRVTHSATVASDGTWTVNFAAVEIPPGEYDATLTAVATDAAGNVETLTDTVSVDTVAGSLTISSAPIEGDDVVNNAEASDGVTLNGTSDPGNVVAVTMGGVTHSVVTDGAGNWTALFAASEIAQGTYDAAISATTTDAAGNTRTVTDSVHVDTVVDNLSVSVAPIEGDDVINFVEMSDGFAVTGTVEVGSTVNVTIEGVSHVAAVDSLGNWSVSFGPTDIAGGEYPTTISVDVTDVAGNTASTSRAVEIDTLVNQLDTTGAVEGDNVINAQEAADGLTLTGQVEAGSAVVINFQGANYNATVDGSGNWSVDIPASGITMDDPAAVITINATDVAGNVRTITETVAVDTSIPDSPTIVDYTRNDAGSTRAITLEMSDDTQVISELAADGTISQVTAIETDIVPLNETLFSFNNTVPDGSHLIVTSQDDAGNTSGTFMALDDTSTSIVDISNPALGAFEIETIDLRFAEDSELTITEAQLTALSGNSDTVVVSGGADDTVTITGAINTGNTTIIEGETHDIYTLGDDGILVIDDDITVVI